MSKKKPGLRELVGEENWPDLEKTGHSIIPNEFMDFWSRYLPENCYFAYLEVCEGFVRKLNVQQLLKTMQEKKIAQDDFIDDELTEILHHNDYILPTNATEILDFLEKLGLIQQTKIENKIVYDICYPIPLPDEVFSWLPEEDREFIGILKKENRACDH